MTKEFQATGSVLELFTHVLTTARRWMRDSSVDLIPVLATDLPSDLALIEQISRHAGAPILAAAAGVSPGIDGVQPSPGLDILKPIIEAVELPPLGRLRVVPTGPDLVAVRFEDAAGPPANPGMRNVLGALTCMLDYRLADARIAVVAYDESNIEEAARQKLWSLLMHNIPGSGAPMPRTLVAIVGNEALTPQHLESDPAIRYILTSDGLQIRHSREVSEKQIAELAAGDDPLVIFLGAGSSVSSGLPLGNSLRDEALRNFFPNNEDASISELIRRFFAYVSDQNRLLGTESERDERYFVENLTLERVLREELHLLTAGKESKTLRYFQSLEDTALKSPGSGVAALRELIGLRPGLVLATVNFDRLIESADRNLFLMRTDEEFTSNLRRLKTYLTTCRGAVPVLKLHGSIGDISSIVANVEVTSLGLSTPKTEALRVLVGKASAPRKWVYVGYSMRDLDIVVELRRNSFVDGVDERWVSPIVDPAVHQFVQEARVPFWKARGGPASLHERSISLTADMFFAELLKAVRASRR